MKQMVANSSTDWPGFLVTIFRKSDQIRYKVHVFGTLTHFISNLNEGGLQVVMRLLCEEEMEQWMPSWCTRGETRQYWSQRQGDGTFVLSEATYP
uniref:Uncharacterized protein n=1 Tax=Chromera velia CCMP2878 TaxID=1169474 RepID=A0A0G4HI96_9ALVE|eukprot:Cvel_27830.t1-p1 / transcript=Cvel_27830.t1 / gene=Cvel_27830 / organism=Chromera_velia_CCMP2878 / gene_product=hypothetical protein / transcript_product=hypothetical protein / location=Cvel_scaffold3537:748-1029(-) / protein_length=94 / sequence_SO=supercontig / SO=protein_coding / is_pseudo=false